MIGSIFVSGSRQAVTTVDGKCVLAEAEGAENGVAQSERHNELRVGCANTLGTLDGYKGQSRIHPP